MKYTKTHQEVTFIERYGEEFLEECSLRDWISWDRESSFELVYEECDEVKKRYVKSGNPIYM
jgi:hypothetical protein